MTIQQRQQWLFRLSMLMALLTAIPLLLFAGGRHALPPLAALALVAAMLAVGIPALVLGVQHALAMVRGSRITATPGRKLQASGTRKLSKRKRTR